ncbi:unnamed protein product [Bemisia tabaci]|uniref:Leucine-rich repeat-containing protein 56 n=1 Tax=Bemisia tabaci TaxID=7038 RepID=A0AAI8UV97_BEMTA|nr:unnamed protein product [Bemisia tabaci]
MAPLCTRVIPQQNEEAVMENEANSDSDAESLSSDDDSFYEIPDQVNLHQQFYANDDSLIQLLQRTTGKEELSEITELKLRAMSEEISLSRINGLVPNLTTLNLDGSSLTSLRELGCSLNKLKVLRVCYCGISSLDGILGFTSLKELYVSYNHIQNIGMCTSLPHLEILDLRRNNICAIGSVEFLSTCPKLRNLTLAENQLTSTSNYRNQILGMIPQLRVLDGIPCGAHGIRCNELNPSDSETTSESSISEHEPTPPESLLLSFTQSANSTSDSQPLPTIPDTETRNSHASSLTSGAVLCGSIAKSLRSKRLGREGGAGLRILSPVHTPGFGPVVKMEKSDAMQASKTWRREAAKLRHETS